MAYDQITYSDKYYDDKYEYRHVMLPVKLAKQVPKNHLMTETEWRNIGVQQSPGWVHYMVHAPERHILLFRRPLPKPGDQSSAAAQESVAKQHWHKCSSWHHLS
ncbi:hypothetical protein BsWGS_16866 [Bradybaena similaris]